MVSWGKAFKTAILYIIFSIIWIIIGGALAIFGFAMIMGKSILTGFILMIIGYIIAGIGGLAAWFKKTAEITAYEVHRTRKEEEEVEEKSS